MPWRDLVCQYWPSASDEEADSILWNCSCFPFCGLGKVKEQLSELAKRSGGDVGKAQALAFRDLEEALEKVKDGERA